MFEMFARVDHPGSDPDRGLGIGLALARQLALLHDGTLTATSGGLGCGSSFTLSLPAVAAIPVSAPGQPATTSDLAGAALNVVVIEDNADITATLTLLLERMGHHVTAARAGEDGVRLIETQKPDVVLCDLGLPGIDGIEVGRLVRRLELERQPLLVALTGWGREADLKRTKEAGFDDHLVKPVKAERLRVILRNTATNRFSHEQAG
jgi:CheY-like chemotaxis protein